MYRFLLPSAADRGCTPHTGLLPLYTDILVYIGIYTCIQRLPSAAVHMSAHCTQASFFCPLYIPIYMPIYIPIYTLHTGLLPPIYRCVYIYVYIYMSAYIDFFFLVLFPLKPLPPSFTRLEGWIPHTHTHTFRFVLF
jgi:hypothetical protein